MFIDNGRELALGGNTGIDDSQIWASILVAGAGGVIRVIAVIDGLG